jgi:hypothetical protein
MLISTILTYLSDKMHPKEVIAKNGSDKNYNSLKFKGFLQ